MQYQLQQRSRVIGARRRERLVPVVETVRSYVDESSVRLGMVLAFFLAHIPVAVLMGRDVRLATLHTLATIMVALWLAVYSKRLLWVACAGAYIAGSEVLWRMAGVHFFWETGKYAVVAVFGIAMVRHWRVRPSVHLVLYFALLLPSAFLTFLNLPFDESRKELSFNLSGPFALMVAGCFFSQLSLSREDLVRIVMALIGPILAVATVAFLGLATADEILFTAESNRAASGGFGPNQVSAVLGLGALASFLMLLDNSVDLRLKIICGVITLILAAQSALTFSRGGLYNVAGAMVLASLFLLKDSRNRIQFFLAIVLVSAVAYFVIFPRLDNFTEGALSARFEDTSTTGRAELAQADLEIWLDNFVFGVGPGLATELRQQFGHSGVAHTEFTRLLAEHGVFGLISLLVLIGAAVTNVLKARNPKEKALMTALVGWSCFFMLNSAMRLVAPSLMFGLAFVRLKSAENIATVPSKQPGISEDGSEKVFSKNSRAASIPHDRVASPAPKRASSLMGIRRLSER